MLQRRQIAALWHELMHVSRKEVFGSDEAQLPATLREDAQVCSPGYVGRNYAERRIALIGINPGGAGAAATERQVNDDRLLYGALRSLRDATRSRDIEKAFAVLNQVWISVQDQHGFSGPVMRALCALCSDSTQIFFGNLVPYRTAENKRPSAYASRTAWNLVLSRQLEALEPHVIVTMGGPPQDFIGRHYVGGAIRFHYKRTLGDRWVLEETAAELKRMRVHAKRAGWDGDGG